MAKLILKGNDQFEEYINDNGYYVDKTELIYELAAQTRNKVTLFTRPRRFGKTLAMSMMESFFDIGRNSRALFEGLNIQKNHQNFCDEWMNRYPVISISFKDVEGLSFEKAYAMLAGEIAKLCIKHSSLEKNEKTAAADRAVFRRLMYKEASEEEIKNSLQTIMRMLRTVYGVPVILLIDEYDVPLAKAEASKNQEYYDQMLDIIRGIMSTSLKSNEFLKFAVVTGCLRISKESIFTGVNNFSCYSVTNRKFSEYFGFKEGEVREILEQYGLVEKYNLIKEWYDGYIFGDTEIFCPWDVISFTAAAIDDEGAQPENYWANTSSNDILNEFVNHDKIDASEKFEILLNGDSIVEEINEELTYDNIAVSEKNLWSVLLMTGYLSKADKEPVKDKMKLKIPNMEIGRLFRDAVVERFNRRLDTSLADSFINAMWNRDEENAGKLLTEILWSSISYFDYGEDYYHGMLNGIFTSRGYNTDSNDESGLGRLDLRVRDRLKRRTIVLEFKRARKDENLSDVCEAAIAQIVKNGYDRHMPEGYEQQLIYGVAFLGKKARVKCRR